MHIIYIDDSADEQLALYSALAIPVEHWRECFALIKSYRSELRDTLLPKLKSGKLKMRNN